MSLLYRYTGFRSDEAKAQWSNEATRVFVYGSFLILGSRLHALDMATHRTIRCRFRSGRNQLFRPSLKTLVQLRTGLYVLLDALQARWKE